MNKVFKHKRGSNGLKVVCEFAKSHCGGGVKSVVRDGVARVASASGALKHLSLALIMAMSVNSVLVTQAKAGVPTDYQAEDYGLTYALNGGGLFLYSTNNTNVKYGLKSSGFNPDGRGANATMFNGYIASGVRSTVMGYGSRGTDGQVVAIGSEVGAYAGQAVVIGNDAFATGASSIAIGNDDIAGDNLYNEYPLTAEDLDNANLQNALHNIFCSKGGSANVNGKCTPDEITANKYGLTYDSAKKKYVLKTYSSGDESEHNAAKFNPLISGGAGSIAIGSRSISLGKGSVALGVLARAYGDQSTALGTLSKATGANSFALGADSLADKDNAMAFGVKTSATMANSVALGYGSKTDYSGSNKKAYMPGNGYAMPMADAVGVISVGSSGQPRRIVNLAAGAEDTDAVNVSQLKALAENLGIEDISDNTDKTMRYLSVDRKNGEAAKIQTKIQKEKDFKVYAQYRKYHDLMQVNIKRSGNNDLYGSELTNLEQEIKKLEDKYGDFKASINSPADLNTLTTNSSEEDVKKIIAEVEKYTDKNTFKVSEGDLKHNASNEGATGKDALAFGYDAKASGDNAVAIGKSADAKGENSITIGTRNTLGDDVTLGKSILIGESNNISGDVGSQNVIIGSVNSVTATTGNKSGQNVIIGNDLSVSNSVGGIAIGGDDMGDTTYDKTTISGNGAIAIGTNTQALKEKATAIGARSKVEVAGGVALGFESVMDRVTNNSDKGAFTGNETNKVGAVSVGASNKERQVINLADGKADTDAVNVRQLKALLGNKAADVTYNNDGTIKSIGGVTGTSIGDVINKLNNKPGGTGGQTIKYFSVKSDESGNSNNDGTKGDNSIAIGPNAKATNKETISIGYNAGNVKDLSVTNGKKFNSSIFIGNGAGDKADSYGYESNWGSIMIGQTSGKESKGDANVFMGSTAGAKHNGSQNIFFGDDAKTYDITNTDKITTSDKDRAQTQGNRNISIGNQYINENVKPINNGTDDSISIGTFARAVTSKGIAIGSSSQNGILGALVKGERGIAIGSSKDNSKRGAQSLSADSVAIGTNAIAGESSANSVALGSNTNVSVAQAVALGDSSVANVAKGVTGIYFVDKNTLGINENGPTWKSTAGAVSVGATGITRQIINLAAGTNDTDAVNVAQLKTVGLDFKGDVASNIVNDFTRTQEKDKRLVTITGGVTDASNLTQNNIGVVSNGEGILNIRLAKALKELTSAEFKSENTTTINGDGVTIKPKDTNKGEVKLTNNGLDNGGNIITNVGDPGNENDAVNKKYVDTAKRTFSGDNSNVTIERDNIDANRELKVTGGATGNYDTEYTSGNIAVVGNKTTGTLSLKLAKNLDLGEGSSIKLGDATISSVKDKKEISLGGAKITNLGAGSADRDAVNVGQVQGLIKEKLDRDLLAEKIKAGTNIANIQKGSGNDQSITINAKGAKVALTQNSGLSMTSSESDNTTTYTLGLDDATKNKINDTANKAMQNLQVIANDATDKISNVGKNDKLNFKAGNNLTVELDKDKHTITYAMKDDVKFNDIQVGKDGVDGKDGKIGVNGADGKNGVVINGKDGTIGLTGATGKDGKDGKDAMTNIGVKDGKPGVNGKNGENITRIVYTDPKDPDNQKVVATLDDGLKFAGNDGTDTTKIINKKLNEKLEIVGGFTPTTTDSYSADNIYVKNDNGKLLINFANKPTFSGGVKLGDIDMTPDGTTLKLTDDTVLTGLGKAQNDSDAVNLKMLKDQIAGLAVGTQSIVNANSPVSYVYDKDNGSGGKTPTIISRYIGNNGDVEYYDPKDIDPSTGKPKTNASKLDVKPNQVYISVLDPDKSQPGTATRFTNLADGTNDGDAINYKQFKNAGWNIANDKKENTTSKVGTVNTTDRVNFVSSDAINVSITSTDDKNFNVEFTPNFADSKISIDASKNYTIGDGDKTKLVSAGKVVDMINTKVSGAVGAISPIEFKGNTDSKTTIKFGEKLDIVGAEENKNTSKFDGGKNIMTYVDTSNNNKKLVIAMAKEIDGINNLKVGEKGEAGKPGADGKIGVNGEDGSAVVINGKDGSIGLNGKNGENGISIKGKDGENGVGIDGKDGTTRIVYTEKVKNPDTGDEKEVTHEVATLDDGFKFEGNTQNTVISKKLNQTLKIKGGKENGDNTTDKDLWVEAKDDTLTIKMAKNLENLESIKFSNGTVGEDVVINKSGIAMGGHAITGLKSDVPAGGLNAIPDNDSRLSSAATLGDLKTINTNVNNLATSGINFISNYGKSTKIKITDEFLITGDPTKDSTSDWSDFDGGKNVRTQIVETTDNGKTKKNLVIALSKEITGLTKLNIGENGTNGQDGTISVNGKDGASVVINGKDGTISVNGKDGANANITVKNGAPGVDGKPGENITRIVYKDLAGKEYTTATLDDGLKFAGDNSIDRVISRKLNEQLNIIGGVADAKLLTSGNIGVIADNENKLNIKLAKNLSEITSITSGTPSNPGTKITLEKDKVILSDGTKGTDGKEGAVKLSGIAKATNDTDAVNKKQVEEMIGSGVASSAFEFQGDDKQNVSPTNGVMKITGGESDGNKLSDKPNIGVVKGDNGELKVKLAKNIEIEGAKIGGVNIDSGKINKLQSSIEYDGKLADKLADIDKKFNPNVPEEKAKAEKAKQEEIAKYKDALNKADTGGAATVGDLANLGNSITNNITNNIIGDLGDLSGKDTDPNDPNAGIGGNRIKTYNPYGDTMKNNQTIVDAIKNINEGGIKYIHVSDMDNKGDGDPTSSINDSQANKIGSIGVGMKAISNGINSIAIGTGAKAMADNAIAIGMGNIVNGKNSGVIGDPSVINAENSYSVGNDNFVGAGDIEYDADGTIKKYQEIKDKNGQKLSDVFVMGNKVKVNVSQALALGSKTEVTQTGGIALGDSSKSTRENSEAQDVYGGSNNQIIGASSQSVENTVAGVLGVVSVGESDKDGKVILSRQITNVAAGKEDSDAVNVAQLKALASVVNSGSVANWMSINMPKDEKDQPIVKPSKASGNNSVAIGNGAVTTTMASNSVALGNDSVANRENTVSVGSQGKERTISNVAPGVLGTDAVNMNQLNALADYVKDTKEKAFAGTAAAMAIGNLPQATIPGKSFMTLGGGYYKGESAIALGVSRISENGKWIAKGSTSMDSQKNFGAAVSVGFHF